MRSILKMRIAFNYSTDADLGIFEQLGPASLRWLPGLGDRGAPCVERAFFNHSHEVRKEKFPVMGFQIPCSLAQGIWPYALEFHR